MTTWIGSPNFEQGRRGRVVKKIIIHHINGTLLASDITFQNPVKNTSAHYAIEDDEVHQYVKEQDTAYHCGNLETNLASIGIEHSADLARRPSDKTYSSSIELCTKLCKSYGLTENDIYPHNSVVPTQCPGLVDLNRIKRGVKTKLEEDNMVIPDKNTERTIKYLMLHRPIKDEELGSGVGKDVLEYMKSIERSNEYLTLNDILLKTFPETVKRLKETEAKLNQTPDQRLEKARKLIEQAKEALL